MKRVSVPAVREEAKYFCDKHPDRECFTEVKSYCWYGSQFDTDYMTVNMCDECMEKYYQFVKENFGVAPIQEMC